ncbi:MAG TPA: ubiquinone/menaquinone biosynthesis methyltransferase [Anaerolineaceae bacterium]|nr:ubiquinone/menaquinone biosynthesis methyltransferase [Anaerolineaceae bacterium]
MRSLQGNEKAQYVRNMFGRIAPRYDLLNRLMTLGQDVRWRKGAVRRLGLVERGFLLDVGTGTGDFARELCKQQSEARIVACDFTPEMVFIGKSRNASERIEWVIADAMNLPFKESTFSGVISGFLLRNVPDVIQTIGEQYRVLQLGGKMVALDTTPPKPGFLHPFVEFHLHYIIPLLGKMIAGDAEAYRYLPDSTENFLSAEVLSNRLTEAGYKRVAFVRRMFGTMAIHWGEKEE